MTNPSAGWSFTSWDVDIEAAKAKLRSIAKKWVFQLEACPSTGRHHLQGKVSLIKKVRQAQIDSYFAEWKWFLTPTKQLQDFTYASKLPSRLEGPWSSDDEPSYVPSDIRGLELWPWQKEIVDRSKFLNTRCVDILYDPTGSCGKTTLVRYCGVHKLGRKLLFSRDYKDIMRMVMDMPKSNLYFCDVARAQAKDNLAGFWSAIEEVKGGYAYDERNHFREAYFDPPHIWVFTNTLPDRTMLSANRWRIHQLVGHGATADLIEMSF